ncbi:hypothetical protein [[Scytonema hofmanni] UTEX B 1581]|nr:hypothetical protein [[Scytonema hofmanni] UTEX B 1581]
MNNDVTLRVTQSSNVDSKQETLPFTIAEKIKEPKLIIFSIINEVLS